MRSIANYMRDVANARRYIAEVTVSTHDGKRPIVDVHSPMTIQPNNFHDLDERQQRIYERLKKAGDGPAAFFLDACRLVGLEPSLGTTTHLVGHCIREIESALRDLLVPLSRDPRTDAPNELVDEIKQILAGAGIRPDDPRFTRWQEIALEEGGETHKNEIKTILAAVGIAESDEVAVHWLKLAGAAKAMRLHDRAHRSGLSARPVDQDFLEFWSQVQAVLDTLLERFEARYLVYIEILNRLLEKKEPTLEDVTTLKNEIPRTLVTYRYFFERLDSPRWFPALRKKGFFASPFPGYWPQAVYLRKIARELPEDVLNVSLSVTTDGLWTHIEFAEAASALPPPLMAKWARHEARWIGSQQSIGWNLPQRYGAVITALVKAGESAAAMELLRSLLSTPAGTQTSSLFEEPPSRLEWAAVQDLMGQVVPLLVEHAPLAAFETFAELLASAIREAHDDLVGIYDSSTVWRESVAHDRGLFAGRRNELVTAVRTCAVASIRTGVASATTIVERLREPRLAIFDRLALHVLAQFPAETREIIAAELFSDLDRLRDDFDRREFGELVAAGFAHLSVEGQRRVVELIFSGPDADAFRVRAEDHGYAITDAHVRRYVLQWRIRFTDVIFQYAPPQLLESYAQWKEELRALAAELEPAAETRMLTELQAMRPSDVVAYFRTVSLPPRPEHARFELGRQFQQVIAAAPAEFSRVAPEVRQLEPHLIHWYFYGLGPAVTQRVELDWPAVVELLEFAVSQPVGTTRAVDNSWGTVRKAAASMLERAFALEDPAVPRELGMRLWKVLTALLESDAGDEAVDVSGNLATTGGHVVSQAANSTRGEAFDAACWLVLWLRQRDATALRQELTTLLDSLLEHDHSLVIRAAVGKNLLHLFDLEQTWFSSNLDRVLPRNQEQTLAWCAAWAGYLSRWRPSAEEFELLREHYSLSIARLLATAPEHSFAADGVAHHLMAEYLSGFVRLDDPLIRGFFGTAPGRIRGHALWYVLHVVDNAKEALTSEVRDRITELVSWRVAAAKDHADRQDELSWFGYFFVLDRFDENWAIETLQSVLKLGVHIDHHRIIERLAIDSRANPDRAFDCYKRLIAGDEHRFLIDEESGREIVRNALQSPASEQDARAFVNRLASEGQFQLADLLS